ncbi:hypothetical protein EJ08DRAFT_335833 [Tothia fuscella]|uniref:Uncharacterized protein n=1 Tax=Tothia fuscella TaxID=1048955 RepID=A0A9P4U396_9PEZI|nr:hypothetical protein EJ08DRAFT_335833 [Tothia fuscella]
MASALPVNATQEEIEEELVFAKVLAESLDRGADDYEEQMMESQAKIGELEALLGLSPEPAYASGSQQSAYSGSGSGSGSRHDNFGLDGIDESGVDMPVFGDVELGFDNDPLTSPLPTFTLDTMSRKRSHGDLSSPIHGQNSYVPNKSMRATPAQSPGGTSPNTPSTDDSAKSLEEEFAEIEREFAIPPTGNQHLGLYNTQTQSDRMRSSLDRQRQGERDALRRAAERKAQLDKDMEFARQMQNGHPFKSGPTFASRNGQSSSSSQAVFNRDGTIRVPSSKKQLRADASFRPDPSPSVFNTGSRSSGQSFKPEPDFPFLDQPSRTNNSNSRAMNGFAAPSPEELLASQPSHRIKAESGTSNHPQQNGGSSLMQPWVPRNEISLMDSDSSDLEEIDLDTFVTSTNSNPFRRRSQNTTMPGSFPSGFNNPNQFTNQNYHINGYGSQGMMNSYHQQPTSTFGGFVDNLTMMGNMVGLGPSRALGSSYSMPGAFPGSSMSNPNNVFGHLGYGVPNHRASPMSRDTPEVIDLDSYQADRARFDYLYSDSTKTSDEIKKLIENIAPGEDLPPEMRDGTPLDMKVALLEHQKIGLTWLKKQEEGNNKGAILADDMGLGKTVQAIALMCSRRSEEPRRKTTLIVAPVALMRQWEYEIKDKLKDGKHSMTVFKYHGATKKPFKHLAGFDVVLTTFGTLASELRRKERWTAILAANPDAIPTQRERLTLLAEDAFWYRVIIDEAQCIKNKNTLTAKAAFQLKSVYRLCMTGTPMMNNVGELYPLINFCRIKPYNDAVKFKVDIGNPLTATNVHESVRKSAMTKLHTLISAVMLRRTKESKLDGKPIISLPPRTNEEANVEFSTEENEFYAALENKTQLTFNRYMKAGSVMKNYANVLVLLLRLRQACCHPHLIHDYEQAGTAEVPAETMIELAQTLTEEVVARIKDAEGNFECAICYDAAENPTIFIPCGHDTCSECFARLTDPSRAIVQGSETAEAKCPQCRGKVDSKKIIDYTTFKKVYMPETLDDLEGGPVDVKGKVDDDEEESDSDSDSDSDDDSDDRDETLGGFVVPDDVNDVEEDNNGESSSTERKPVIKSDKGKAKSKGKGKGKKKRASAKGADKFKQTRTLAQLRKEGLRNKSARRKYLRRLRKEYIPSAKITQTINLLEEIHENDPKEKVLIFSQFTSLLDLLEIPMSDKPETYRRYDGSMTPAERADAVMYFKEHAKCTVMLVSLKAGNAGLNLNCASQVIIMDPFWNPYIEEQAIDRAHRIGQMNPVKVHKVLVPGTVEDRIVALQEKKRGLISEALDENAGKSVARLGVRELAYLFGVGNAS